MTSDSLAAPLTVNSASAPQTRRRARTAAWTVALIGAAALGGAWIFQLGLGLVPCPLCLEQRYAYYAVIPLTLLLALAAGKLPPAVLRAGLVLAALAMLGNAGLGVYHAGVEWGFWAGPTDCSGPVLDLGKAKSLLDQLDTIKVVRCDEVQWRFLGLSLAGYNALISLAMAVIAVSGARRGRD